MRCKACEYRLWNLRSRECPECGAAFKPSEFEFTPNAVRFCCPHCEQAYYGQGEKGQLNPVEFDCVKCGQHIHMDEMVLLPTEGVEEEWTELIRQPWLDRSRIGFVRAWFRTVGYALIKPGRLMALTPASNAPGEALWFAMVTNTVTYVGTVFLLGVLVFFGSMFSGGGVGAGGVAEIVGGMVILVLVSGFAALVILCLWAAIVHAILRLTGRTQGAYDRTLTALSYSLGANVVSITPCIGIYFGWIWWLVSAVLMVRGGQRVHGGRAALAVLILPILVVGGTIWAMAWGSAFVARSGTATVYMSREDRITQAETVLNAMISYANDHQGIGPAHPAELVMADLLSPEDYFLESSDRDWSTVPMGDVMFSRFVGSTTNRRRQIIKAAIDRFPEDLVASRLGDFVFCHYGGDVSSFQEPLWLVILSEVETDGPEPFSGGVWVAVGRSDGEVQALNRRTFETSLEKQNALRASAGLAPLPDPSIVTELKPAGATQERGAGGN